MRSYKHSCFTHFFADQLSAWVVTGLMLGIAISAFENPWSVLVLLGLVGLSFAKIDDSENASTSENASSNGSHNESGNPNSKSSNAPQKWKSHLLADVAHEMRNTLSLIMGPLNLMEYSLDDAPDEVKHQLEIAMRNGKRLSAIIDQMVDLTQLEVNQLRLRKEAYDLCAQLRMMVDSYSPLAQRQGVSFTRLMPDQEIIINADRQRMSQVFSNLLSNAIKFSPEGGYIDVAANLKGSGVLVQVKDTGEGISEKVQQNLFKRFYSHGSEKVENREGLGIGLSMSYEYVRKHGGELSVESAEGKGATFKVWLPLIQDDSLRGYSIERKSELRDQSQIDIEEDTEKHHVQPRKLNTRMRKATSSNVHVLILEDDQELRAYIQDILIKECQVATHTATTVDEAWQIMEETDMDLVITDLQLPGETGFGLIERIQNSFKLRLLPILIITGRKNKQARIKGFQIGINDFMSKPFDPQELVVRVQNLLRNKIERDLWMGNEFARIQEQGAAGAGSGDKAFQRENRSYQQEELDWLDELVNYVRDHLTNTTMTVEDVAFEMKLSKRQLYRRCKELTGLTPAHLIREIRLQRAQVLLDGGQVNSIGELINAVGYNNSGYFSRLYEDRFGRKPFQETS